MPELIDATIQIGKLDVPFRLCHRTLDLDNAGNVSYYWMDTRQLRDLATVNNRSCVDYFLPAIESQDLIEPKDVVNSFLAELFQHISNSRIVQKVYLHARIDRRADTEVHYSPGDLPEKIRQYDLPERARRRLHKIAFSRNEDAVRRELEKLFLLKAPTKRERDRCAERADEIFDAAIKKYNERGQPGLKAFAAELMKKFEGTRRRSGENKERQFLNFLFYEAKIAFYLCYTNAWIGLIPWLKKHRGLDAKSEHLLRLWHNQNQPRENPENIAGASRDVFCGQILALHPLSAFIFEKPNHRVALGDWIGHAQFDLLVQTGKVSRADEYLRLIEAILIAATEYRDVRRRWDTSRKVKEVSLSSADAANVELSITAIELALNAYVAWNKIACEKCKGDIRFLKMRQEAEVVSRDAVVAIFQCACCRRKHSLTIRREDFLKYLK